MPRHKRLLMLYLLLPKRRGRCATGSSVMRAPSMRASAGRKRCMPENGGSRLTMRVR